MIWLAAKADPGGGSTNPLTAAEAAGPESAWRFDSMINVRPGARQPRSRRRPRDTWSVPRSHPASSLQPTLVGAMS
jgi:hypothetical protein